MKNVKNALILLLAVALMVGVLSGCSLLGGIKLEELEGSWTMVKPDTEEEALALLELIEAYEEEIALADLTSLEFVKMVEFDADKNYCFRYDVEGTKECVYDFYDRYFDALYEGRTSLNEAYGETFDEIAQANFQQYFAEVYGHSDYAALLDSLAENAYNYDALEEPFETGTFTIEGDQIMCTITGDSKAESLGVEIEEDMLTLTYVDAVEVYNRAD